MWRKFVRYMRLTHAHTSLTHTQVSHKSHTADTSHVEEIRQVYASHAHTHKSHTHTQVSHKSHTADTSHMPHPMLPMCVIGIFFLQVAKEARAVVEESYDAKALDEFTVALTPAFGRAMR